jgi:hypothetical protein
MEIFVKNLKPLKIWNKILLVAFYITFKNSTCFAQHVIDGDTKTKICIESGTSLLYFNGILVSKEDAEKQVKKITLTFGSKTNAGDHVKYRLMYNHTQGLLLDLLEVFEQRAKEFGDGSLVNRLDLFMNYISNFGGLAAVPGIFVPNDQVSDFFIDLGVDFKSKILEFYSLQRQESKIFTIKNHIEHQAILDNLILEGKKLLFFAHSQGNLFANHAFDYAKGKTQDSSIRLIHVAPASIELKGDHVLADTDEVILKLSPTHNPTHFIKGVHSLINDFKGHGLFEIYLNPNFPILSALKQYVAEAFDELIAPRADAKTGFFTATLTWDGQGDVDLHVNEPTGAHVYFSNKIGNSGYLDVDNTYAFGPEHYYSSCDSRYLKEGIYKISVANYSKAKGRIATLQISNSDEGVLGTKQVILGGETGRHPDFHLFQINLRIIDQVKKIYNINLI